MEYLRCMPVNFIMTPGIMMKMFARYRYLIIFILFINCDISSPGKNMYQLEVKMSYYLQYKTPHKNHNTYRQINTSKSYKNKLQKNQLAQHGHNNLSSFRKNIKIRTTDLPAVFQVNHRCAVYHGQGFNIAWERGGSIFHSSIT